MYSSLQEESPTPHDLGLEQIGVKVNRQGYVLHDEKLSTNIPGIWVAGDARGGPLFTHTSWDDFRILQSQILGDGSRTLNRIVPYAIFTILNWDVSELLKSKHRCKKWISQYLIFRFQRTAKQTNSVKPKDSSN